MDKKKAKQSIDHGSSLYKQVLIVLFITGNLSILQFFPKTYKPNFTEGHPHRKPIQYFRFEIADREEIHYTTLIQEDFAREDLLWEYPGTCKEISGNSVFPKQYDFSLRTDESQSCLQALVQLNEHIVDQRDIWITKVEYPTTEEGVCLKFEYEYQFGRRFAAKFVLNCKAIYRLTQRWFQGQRDSIEPIPEDDVHLEMGADGYGVSFIPANPSHFSLNYWNNYPDERIAQYPLTNLSFSPEDGIIRAQQLDENLELREVIYSGWKKRLYLAMTKYVQFIENEDRAYGIQHVVSVEGGSDEQMTQGALLVWRARKKMFEVTSEDNRLLWTIESRDQMQLQIVDEDGKKKFDSLCMKFEFENDLQETHRFRIDANCDLIYYDLLKLD